MHKFLTLSILCGALLCFASPVFAHCGECEGDMDSGDACSGVAMCAGTESSSEPGDAYITGISYAMIVVDNTDDAIDWYTTAAGAELKEDETLDDFRWVTIQFPGMEWPRVSISEPHPEMGITGPVSNLVLGTSDCAAMTSRLADAGATILQAAEERPYGIESVWTDPWGNTYVMIQPLEM